MAGDSKAERERRLAEALRANLRRRKAATRGRDTDERPGRDGKEEPDATGGEAMSGAISGMADTPGEHKR